MSNSGQKKKTGAKRRRSAAAGLGCYADARRGAAGCRKVHFFEQNENPEACSRGEDSTNRSPSEGSLINPTPCLEPTFEELFERQWNTEKEPAKGHGDTVWVGQRWDWSAG